MTRWLLVGLVLAVGLLTVACAEDPGPEQPQTGGPTDQPPTGDDDHDGSDDEMPGEDETPPEGDTPGEAEARTITGVLAGDADLEGGCVWLEDGDDRFEVLWPDGYVAEADALEVRDSEGNVVATGGDQVVLRGRLRPDQMSICQVGEIFQATEVVDVEAR